MVDGNENRVYCVQADPKAVSKATRRIKILTFVPLAVVVTLGFLMWWIEPPDGSRLPAPVLVAIWSVAIAALALLLRRCSLDSVRQGDILIGADFIAGPPTPSSNGISVARYRDIVRVTLGVSKGRITGVTVKARGFVAVSGAWLADPTIVVRAVFENAPKDVKWRRPSWLCTRKLSREQVKEVLDKAHVSDIDQLLPPSAHYASADELLSRNPMEELLPGKRGRLGRLFGSGTCRSLDLVTLQTPTPVSRCVGLMLLQMSKNSPAIRILRRSEPPPIATFDRALGVLRVVGDVLARTRATRG